MKVLDGNKACSNIAYLFSEIASIYPITPSSPMASNIDSLRAKGKLNMFGNPVKVIEMQSEAGAAGCMHGALISGSLASTYTASQGLLLMIPNMYKIAGEMLPAVIHVASRTIATHALSIFGDHSDVYACRATGFCMLASTNVFDASNLAAVAHLSAIKGSLPFIHFFDGFRTSHEYNKIDVISENELKKLIPNEEIKKFKDRMLKPTNPYQMGMALNEDIYFQSVEARNTAYEEMPDIVNDYMEKINDIMHTDYKPFNYYGDLNATNIIVAMGSVCDTAKLVIDDLNKNGKKYGLIEVHLYRPFSSKYLLNVLPKSVKNIAVLDRTKEIGSNGEPLYLDILSAVAGLNIHVVGGRYGLSSKNIEPKHIKSVYDMLETDLKNNFTIGIVDDVTNTSLPDTDYEIKLDSKEIKIFGFGSDGMVSASKDILKIIGDNTKEYVEGYFEYDSKKSGGLTISHLRVSDNVINAPFYVTNPSLVIITKDGYLSHYNCLDNISKNGILIINTNKNEEEINNIITSRDKAIIKEKNITVFIIDASKLATESGIKGKISKIMETIILRIVDIKDYKELILNSIKEDFKTKGEEVINSNIKAVDNTFDALHKLTINDVSVLDENSNNIFEVINKHQGNELKVSNLLPYKSGAFPSSLTKEEKRATSNLVPKWNSEKCIQCGICSLVCPHAVIRPILGDDGIPLRENDKIKYQIVVSEADCTGCMLCATSCPSKALTMGKIDLTNQDKTNRLFNEQVSSDIVSKYTIKGSQLQKPLFEFSGACAGCGETAYIKLLTQLAGPSLVIANATGCSSIYGGSAPSTPYGVSWANSLFEDNAEFGYGMLKSYQNERDSIVKIMEDNMDKVSLKEKELYNSFIKNMRSLKKTTEIYHELKEINTVIPDYLIPYIPTPEVWTIGGDGWAYDIGFGGIDHVLSSGDNVNILVLDTEVYSNTGGQASKSSRYGAVAEFADAGKRTPKKDLFKIAMCYPNTYVASISLGANYMQAIKAFKEAMEHDGPSIIIAYAPCIEQGIKKGMSCSITEEKETVLCGYNILMRYLPESGLVIDSSLPDFTKYENFLSNEVRYNALKIKDPKLAEVLLKENEDAAKDRYNYYKSIEKKV